MLISLFNGFPFHHETFGVFLYYFTKRGHRVQIFTHPSNLQWLEFYKTMFRDVEFFPESEFNETHFNASDYVILTTDDDPHFPFECMKLPRANQKVISYDHNIALRQPLITRHITTRPYPGCTERASTPFLYPICPMISLEEKRARLADEPYINIAVVGGSWNTNAFWKCLLTNNDMSRIRIFFIHRFCPGVWNRMDKYVKSICPNTEIHIDCSTFTMIDLLKRSHYVAFLTDIDQFAHHSCSGSVGLAFNTGCAMIMTKKYNSDYQFRNVVYFDDAPRLTVPELNAVFDMRDAIVAENMKTCDAIFAPVL